MNNIYLKHTKIRLTIIFTLLVFWIVVLLEFFFFSVKYINNNLVEKNQFIKQIDIAKNNWFLVDSLVKLNSGLNMWNKYINHEKFYNSNLNFVIVDNKWWKIIFSNIIDEIWADFTKSLLIKNKYGIVKQDSWYLFKKININNDKWNYDILFVKKLHYPFAYYLADLISFIFITLLFSALFYYVWIKFVSHNLKPVEDNLSDMHDFIHNVWYKLKTPISMIDSNLKLIKETKSFDKNLVKEWIIEINRLNNLIESLVELSNINSSMKIEKLDLKDVIKWIIKDFKNDAIKKDISIRFSKKDDKIILMNSQYFYILFSNILANAIKYNKIWWKINITLYKDKISIKDTWIWINNEDIEKIFDRFYMSDNSKNSEWHGIWLSLVKKIANLYKMKINVESEEGKWSEFIIEF